MPYGRFQGKTLSEIASRQSGVNYLTWCSENLRNDRVREVISVFLEKYTKQPVGA